MRSPFKSGGLSQLSDPIFSISNLAHSTCFKAAGTWMDLLSGRATSTQIGPNLDYFCFSELELFLSLDIPTGTR